MRLLQIPNYYYPHTGGIEQVARNIADSLAEEKIDHKIICFNEDAQRDGLTCKRNETRRDLVNGIEVIRCGCFAKFLSQSLSLSYPFELKKTIKEFDPDVIIFHYPNPYVASFLLPQIKKDVKFILYWDLDITKQKFLGKLFIPQTKHLLERADDIIVASPNYIEGSDYLPKYKEKCKVIPNCVAIDFHMISDKVKTRAEEIRKLYEKKCICFTIGRHIPYKGFEYLIKAASYLKEDYIFLIGGAGPLTAQLKEMAKNLDNVHLIGFLDEEELLAHYVACDIITFSSITKNEAFGLSLAEGMSFGKPAVTFMIPGSGVNYVNLNNVTGIEVPNRDCEAYAAAIDRIWKEKTLYQKYASAAKKRVEDLFTFERFRNNIIDLLVKNNKS